MKTPLLILLCSTLAVACTPNAVNNNTFPDVPPGSDVPASDVPPGIDQPVVPSDTPVNPDDTPVVPGDSPSADVPSADVPPADVPITPTACRSSRDCARGVCDRVTSVCVECVSAAQCSGATPVCQTNRCVAAVACFDGPAAGRSCGSPCWLSQVA